MAKLGNGTTLTMSGFTANIVSIDGPDVVRDAIQTSHMGTTDYHTFIPASLVDGGSLDVEIQYDNTSTVPITGAATTVTIVWGGGGGRQWVFSGFVTGLNPSAAIDEVMTATVTIKVTGGLTIT